MDKRQASYILHRVYKLIGSDDMEVLLERIRGTHGMTDFRSIWLNPNMSILPTVIHESLHIFYPDLPEGKIAALEKQVCKHMSMKQFKNLLLRLAWTIND